MDALSFAAHPELLLPAGILMWMGLCVVTALFSGWWTLGRVYRSSRPFTGTLWRRQSVGFRWSTSYGGLVNVGVNSEGLYLSVLLLFRIGHPPLFIPWCDISAESKKSWLIIVIIDLVVLRCRQATGVPICVTQRLAARIRREAGSAWPGS